MTVIAQDAKPDAETGTANVIPMGTFGLLVAAEHKRRHIQSAGFGSCIGLAMHSPSQRVIVLAHFMSHNRIKKSLTLIDKTLESQKVKPASGQDAAKDWDIVVFLGGQGKKFEHDGEVTTKRTNLSGIA